ncbi:MAG: hypothetical protein ABWX92_07125 [Mycetocola sp.]
MSARTERAENREWIERERERNPEGWESAMVAAFGMEGALDVLALQEGRPLDTNLTHTPFAGNDELKDLVMAARSAVWDVQRAAHEIAWRRIDEVRRKWSIQDEQNREPSDG